MSTEGAKILIVEDEPNLGKTLSEYLSTLGYKTYLASTVFEARTYFDIESPYIVLMDIGLPDGDGLSLGRELREKKKDFVLFFLSALNDPQIRVEGLEIGASDYITKPFDLRELTLRLSKTLEARTDFNQTPKVIELGPLKINFTAFEIINAQGKAIAVTQKERAILEILWRNKNNVIEREKIIEKVWNKTENPSSRTVDNYIVKLRKWCETSHGQIKIESIRGVGYKLTTIHGE